MGFFLLMKRAVHFPIVLLLMIGLLAGVLTFRDYGLSWDEPLFYEYADALGYAYTPANWFDPAFDLSQAYGISGDDHKTRGPAYLLLARTPVYLLESIGVDEASAWHLVNFITFLIGVYLLYRLGLRWMGKWAAFSAAALFLTQPLLWGHAFINPKDPPFMVFFTGALLFGFELVDALSDSIRSVKHKVFLMTMAAFFLGIAASIRVLGPLAGVLVAIYALVKTDSKSSSRLLWLFLYTALAILIMFLSWPYLWEAPVARFFEVFRFMSENPTGLQVLFGGEVYRAYELPRRYLPTLLGITLTEPVWIMFSLGILAQIIGIWKRVGGKAGSRQADLTGKSPEAPSLRTDYWLLLAWFFIPLLYVILRKPPMYDGFRHFLFILPPVFITCGLAFEWFLKTILPIQWLRALAVFLIVLPGLLSIPQLHPYAYTYYNKFVGGTGGAFRSYETDYWLTCYKEAVGQLNLLASLPADFFVHREAYIAAIYAADGLTVREERGNLSTIQSGDYILINTRTNEDRRAFHDAPVLLQVGRAGALFCVVKQIP